MHHRNQRLLGEMPYIPPIKKNSQRCVAPKIELVSVHLNSISNGTRITNQEAQ